MTAQISATWAYRGRCHHSHHRQTVIKWRWLDSPLICHVITRDEGQATYWLGVVAFGKQAEALAKHSKGDMISVSGNMQLNQWTGQDGAKREQAQVIADSVISAKTVRPGGRKATSNQVTKPQNNVPPEYENYPFNDDPEF